MGAAWSAVSPYKPTFTEKHLTDQTGKVFIVTGASGGIGKELATILYQQNAKVYLAARSATKTQSAIEEIQSLHPTSKGELVYLQLDLSDLTTIKKSAETFLAAETRLDVLWNNAGVMVPPEGSKTVQGYELQLGTNNIGPFLFTHFLTPILTETAKTAPKGSVRVVWVSSSAIFMAPKPPIDYTNMDYHNKEGPWLMYSRSKTGNLLHSIEFSRRVGKQGVLSLSLDPGFLLTDLQRSMSSWQYFFIKLLAYPAKYGAYTELFAGMSPTITEDDNGRFIQPFGRVKTVRPDFWEPEIARKYWEWTEEQIRPYIY